MSNALVTIIAPLDPARVTEAEAAIDKLENPARADIRAALDKHEDGESGTHFASLHAITSQDGKRAYIVFEFSADGDDEGALARIDRQIGAHLRPVFEHASDWSGRGDLLAYMRRHSVVPANGWMGNPGALFAGTPDITVGRIHHEARLAALITGLLAQQKQDMPALKRVAEIRERVKNEKDAFKPATARPVYEQPALAAFIFQLALSFVKTYLLPVVVLVLLYALAMGVAGAMQAAPGFWWRLGAGALAFVTSLWASFWVAVLLVAIVGGIAYGLLRRAEENDSLEERPPAHETNAAMFDRENQANYAQNHMISVTQRKPGLIRWFTSRLVFWAVGEFAARYYKPGYLSDIGTIHFARWVTTPGGPDVLFFSNYDSSWESYLEDFITRAHAGLTGIWSNSIGFPRSKNLIEDGATDGERFKRYARHSMVPTRFWYSAYPHLTTTIVRNNAEIRRGLSGTMTEDEAIRWLSLFGSAARPASKLVSSEIQSLVFGGLNFLEYGTCLLFDDLPEDGATARAWLAGFEDKVAYNDGRRLESQQEAAITLALGARGLKRLGMPEEGLATFPFAFLDGMVKPARARILGDTGVNAPERWTWGRTQPDVALLIYGTNPQAVAAMAKRVIDKATDLGIAAPREIPLKKVADDKKEPFGFVDGISQPVIRGTYKGMRNADPIHLVEAGEFILGYPDNRGNVPPGPTLPATSDPYNRLPLVGEVSGFDRTVVENVRDLGFNGTFLVIRQLEQDVKGFKKYCDEEAVRLKQRLLPPYRVNSDFIAAKLIGRWYDGSSLMRYPYESRKDAAAKSATQLNDAPRLATTRSAAIAAPAKAAVNKVALVAAARAAVAQVTGGPPSPAAGSQQIPGIVVQPNRKTADNDFLFGAEDPEALRCPFGSHIRRANPRESFDPGSNDQIEITNRHRIMRVGRVYQEAESENPGLLFMCLNGDIERQFEFVQQTWLMSPSFHGLSCEKDPVLGDGQKGACDFTIPNRDGPITLQPMPAFITTRGGGYFFMPGKRLVDFLLALDPPASGP